MMSLSIFYTLQFNSMELGQSKSDFVVLEGRVGALYYVDWFTFNSLFFSYRGFGGNHDSK